MIVFVDNVRHLRWLMAVRAVVAVTLLLSAFALELILSPPQSLTPFYLLGGLGVGLVAGYMLVFRRWHAHPGFAVLQVGGDMAIVTGFVYVSGGLRSPLAFLYLLPIITASVLLPRWLAFAAAGTAWVCYAGLVLATVAGMVPAYPPGTSSDITLASGLLWYSLLAQGIGFPFAALLSSSLAERLRSAGQELVARRSDIAELRALNENIVESITSGLITTDLEGRITFVNPAGCEITGRTPAQLAGTSVTDLFGLEPEFLVQLRGILGEERRYRFEKSCQLRDREERFLGVAASVLRDRGDRASRPLGLIFIFQDLTEIIALEREVRMKERMAALGEMAAGMAHELRNPLASVVGSVQVLRGEMELEGEQAELMEIILRESERLDGAIRDFLLFARPGAFSPHSTDLVRLIGDSVRLLRNSRGFGPEHRVVTVFESEEMTCEIDVNRAKQVFWNLATNALKAMPDGGTLTIRAESAGADKVRVEFADEGVGMSEQQLERLFQPFQGGFRDGTGLGAAIVYRIVQEHQGHIAVHSIPGQGTQVSVTLPVTASPEAGRAPLRMAGGFH